MSQRSLGLVTALVAAMLAANQSPTQAAPMSYYVSANGSDANPRRLVLLGGAHGCRRPIAECHHRRV
jgi:hypothetical protein